MVDMSGLANTDGQTTEEKLQNAIAGDDIELLFKREGQEEVFFTAVYKQGITFEWVKNKVAEQMEANYADLSLYFNGRRIPEPFCLIDMGVATGSEIIVQVAEGAVLGHEALRAQVLAELAEEEGKAGEQ
mmetsp:Transcript_41052/g.53825  ORF Transcript_41052/g.53825 Transcript_41052/m.53825 type:complete len:130 (+) Transcript_41052:49-438(+)|eukprot:CAMPEP_0170475010 /NCGR_PEP_ID=MMETSP0123-20130129/16758_1 /TAXON_ID=182087 /ORGANISM="Favella ehrenbergii, Strain Fehren 1" /LENGTH=129 /DNA_ID=CAMNT_0010745287 /DNA_START=38 /DNA_END=427 /DNA_ORIENTATION=-